MLVAERANRPLELMAGRKENEPQIGRVAILDIGSTNLKISVWNHGDSLLLPNVKNGVDSSRVMQLNIEQWFKEDKINGRKFKYVDADCIFNDCFDENHVYTGLSANLREMDGKFGPMDLYVLTGFTNSLSVSGRDDQGKERRFVLLDEPSLRTDLTPEQRRIISKYMDHPEKLDEQGLKIASTLMKICAFMNHTEELTEKLFHRKIPFSNLRFSTMQGLVTDSIVNRQNPSFMISDAVPAGGDRRSWGGGTGVMSEEIIENMVRELGINADQVHFLEKAMLTYYKNLREETKIYTVQDNDANLWLISQLMERGRMADDVDVVEGDSVAKIGRRYRGERLVGKLKQLYGMEYDIQRMASNALNIIGRPLAKNKWMFHWDYYTFLKGVLEDRKRKQTTRFFYLPDVGDEGMLVEYNDGKIVPINPLENNNYSWDDVKDILLAITRDVFFGIREKQEYVRQARGQDTRNIKTILHGGFSYKNDPGREIAAQSLAGKVYLAELSFAGQAAFLKALSELNGNFETLRDVSVDWQEVPTSSPLKRDEEYAKWKEVRELVDRSGVARSEVVFKAN